MRIFIVLLFIILSPTAFAQHPVKWNFSSEQVKANSILKFDADIQLGWHIYSQFTPDGGPLPMLFTFDSATCYTRNGKVEEPKQIKEYDTVFGLNVMYLEDKPRLTQKIKVNSVPCKVSGKIEYQACME